MEFLAAAVTTTELPGDRFTGDVIRAETGTIQYNLANIVGSLPSQYLVIGLKDPSPCLNKMEYPVIGDPLAAG